MKQVKKIYWEDDAPTSWFTQMDDFEGIPVLQIERHGKDKYALLIISFGEKRVGFSIGKSFVRRLNEFLIDLEKDN